MTSPLDRAVLALLAAQETVALLPPDDRLRAGEQLAAELRTRGALRGVNLNLDEFFPRCDVRADGVAFAFTTEEVSPANDDAGMRGRPPRARRFADLDSDIPF